MTQLERYSKTFTKFFKIKKCSSCGKLFEIGDKLIRTRVKRHNLYHEDCFYAEPKKVKKRVNPNTCIIRRTGTNGPLSLCSDLSCFKKCVKIIGKEARKNIGDEA